MSDERAEADRREILIQLLQNDEDAAAELTGYLFGAVMSGEAAYALRFVTSPAVDPGEFLDKAHVAPHQRISLDEMSCDSELMYSGTLGGHLFAFGKIDALLAAIRRNYRIYGSGSKELGMKPFNYRYYKNGGDLPMIETLDALNSVAYFQAGSDLYDTHFVKHVSDFLEWAETDDFEDGEIHPGHHLMVYLRVVTAIGVLDDGLLQQLETLELETQAPNPFSRLAGSL